MAFKLESFINDCKSALKEEKPPEIVRQLLLNAIATPESVFEELGTPERSAVEKLYVSDSLTIINVVWAPKMTLLPHNHRMWAVIGVYSGREDNIFWRRLDSESDNSEEGRIEAAGAKSIGAGEAIALGKNIIHSVTNPTTAFTSAIHVYGGDFFTMERSEWDPLSLTEQAYDIEKNMKYFEEQNALLAMPK
ncbi:MAG: hypothetical protein CMK89_13775 [Pseudomonadales bacterium]|nr:hypothetical protein [Pseudomonadales bacterium]